MDLRHLTALRAFEAALRCGTFRAAAEELGVTTAAVGQQVRLLEKALGIALFERQAGGVRPTAAARQVAPLLTGGFAQLAEAWAQLSRSRPARRLALSVTPAFSEHWLPPLLPDFLAAHGEVDLRIEVSPKWVDLTRGEIDFAFRYGPEPGPEYAFRPLFPPISLPVCSPDFARRYGLGPGATDLTGVPLCHALVPTKDPDAAGWDAWSRRTGIALGPAEGRGQFSGYGNVLRYATAGLGLALGGIVEIAHDIAAGRLVAPFGPAARLDAGWPSRLVWLKARRLSPVQAAFRDRVAGEAAATRRRLAEIVGPL